MRPYSSLFTLVILLLSLPGLAWAQENAESQTQALISAFQAVHPASDSLSEAQKKENLETYSRLDKLFDIEAFVDACIEPSEAKFSPEQLVEFKQSFALLVRLIAYPSSGEFLKEAEITTKVLPPEAKSQPVQLDLYLASEDLDVVVTFIWTLDQNNHLRVSDVLFDGESLITEYQNQFAKLIEKEGVPALLEKIAAKKAELEDTP